MFDQLLHRIDPTCRLTTTRTLTGGVSAKTTAIDITRAGGQTETWVVREQPNAEAHYKLLDYLYTAGLPVPQPLYANSHTLVMTYINAQTDFTPPDVTDYLTQAAALLARIHRTAPPPFLPESPTAQTFTLDGVTLRIEPQASVLRHGDYWPGNWLWRDGQLVAVIDWEDAARGDPLADLANTRLELLWAFGEAAMHDFTRLYTAQMPALDVTPLPRWDAYAAWQVRPKIDTWTDDLTVRVRFHTLLDAFIKRALAG